MVTKMSCALNPLFHYRAQPRAQVADRNSKIWVPQPSKRGLGFICNKLGIQSGRWYFFGRNGTDFINYQMSSYLYHWTGLKNPAIVVPIGIHPRIIHAWLRAFKKAVQRPTLVLVPPFTNTPWFRELFSHLPRVIVPFSEKNWWTRETYLTKGNWRTYLAFCWKPDKYL